MSQEPLNPDERGALKRWQTRMLSLFVVGMIGLFGIFAADLVFGLSERSATIAVMILVAVTIVAGFVQFGQKCPRCGYRIGFQSRLTVPDNCKKCGVPFK